MNAVSLNAMQSACLSALAIKSRPNGEMCRPFSTIERATGLSRADVRRSVRALARKGLAEFHSGLCTEDGEFAGSGYCISKAGQERAGPTYACEDCGEKTADPPSKVCPGCEAYREHTGAI